MVKGWNKAMVEHPVLLQGVEGHTRILATNLFSDQQLGMLVSSDYGCAASVNEVLIGYISPICRHV